MEIHLIVKDKLEAQGIRWIVESHLAGVRLILWDTLEEFENGLKRQEPDLVILDMDGWANESERFGRLMQQRSFRWLGISSERIFQTAYRALRFRADDVLFRPFSSSDFINHVQQLRNQMRNHERYFPNNPTDAVDTLDIGYHDLFLRERKHPSPIMMAAFLTPHSETLPQVYDALQRYPFTGKNRLFALSNFILCVQEVKENTVYQEEYHAFLVYWKKLMDEPIAIVMKEAYPHDSLKRAYQETHQLMRRVFFEGYDIILAENKHLSFKEMDPFLTPLEQRQWIEMLEKRDIKAIRDWVEREFLTFQEPYPDPEMVRVRLTSVLAQIRRHMKSYGLQSVFLEAIYHKIFQQIVHMPVIYQIIQELLLFTARLLEQDHQNLQKGPRTLAEKARELIESNYWDAQWNLAACADALRINKSTLSRRFAAESGRSFRDTLHEVRIGEAKRLLQETDLSLEEIARLTGYTHQTYFNSKFKQCAGCTPLVYRSGIKI
ncbi:helix-turn-helix domain-containing protein [Neobacillus cucumis]|uniref:response regulator transcription factor n=1 Tax=Neobacillus cucumis TaxID=1740721 RepID=UPI002041ED27|nr:helix-turn-helix domain-containing protein [Neobacillus cucumis]MCM3725126.1 helix-turn-helix domain-containing protein [Neobacillus cucumis]